MIIRPYQFSDKKTVMQIAGDTAFFGRPLEAIFDDRRLFWDSFYEFFFRFQSNTCWVAERNGIIVGFLAGSPDATRQARVSTRHIYPVLLWNLLTVRYHLGRKTVKYVLGMVSQVIQGKIPAADLKIYPAHLHINVVEEARGGGIGRKLLETYHQQLQELNVPGVHLHTTDQNLAACRLYEKVGYQLLDARFTTFWETIVGTIVENRCYGLRLNKK